VQFGQGEAVTKRHGNLEPFQGEGRLSCLEKKTTKTKTRRSNNDED
jgi:hypothetical protein